MIAIGLFNLLKTIPEIGNRVYPITAPQNPVSPFIIYQRIDPFDTTTIEGTQSLDLARYQIKIFSKTYFETLTIKELVKEKLNGKGLKLMDGEDQEPDTKLYVQHVDYQLSDDLIS